MSTLIVWMEAIQYHKVTMRKSPHNSLSWSNKHPTLFSSFFIVSFHGCPATLSLPLDLAWDLDLTFAVIYLFLPWLNFSDSCHSQHLLYMLWPCCSLIAQKAGLTPQQKAVILLVLGLSWIIFSACSEHHLYTEINVYQCLIDWIGTCLAGVLSGWMNSLVCKILWDSQRESGLVTR